MPRAAAPSHFRWQQDYNGSTVLSRSRQRGVMAVCHTSARLSKSGEAFPSQSPHATTLAPIRSPLRLTQPYMAQSRPIRLLRAQPFTCTAATPKPAAMATRKQHFFLAEGLTITMPTIRKQQLSGITITHSVSRVSMFTPVSQACT